MKFTAFKIHSLIFTHGRINDPQVTFECEFCQISNECFPAFPHMPNASVLSSYTALTTDYSLRRGVDESMPVESIVGIKPSGGLVGIGDGLTMLDVAPISTQHTCAIHNTIRTSTCTVKVSSHTFVSKFTKC